MSTRRVNQTHRLNRGNRNDKFSRFLKKRPRTEYSPKRRSYLARIMEADSQSGRQVIAKFTYPSELETQQTIQDPNFPPSPFLPRLNMNVKKLFCRSLKRQHRQKLLGKKKKAVYKPLGDIFGRGRMFSVAKRNSSIRSPRRKTRAFSPKRTFPHHLNHQKPEIRNNKIIKPEIKKKYIDSPPTLKLSNLEIDFLCPDLDLDSGLDQSSDFKNFESLNQDFSLDKHSHQFQNKIHEKQGKSVNFGVSSKIKIETLNSRNKEKILWSRCDSKKNIPKKILGFMHRELVRRGNESC